MAKQQRVGGIDITLMHGIVLSLAAFFALPKALHYGGIWDVREHPAHNVTVTTPNARVFPGTLSREWDGRTVLVSEDGAAWAAVTAAHVIAFPPPTGEMRSFHSRWRAWLPAGILAMLVLSYICTVLAGGQWAKAIAGRPNLLKEQK
ncbi:hypothetical protein [Variovorax paradoxus]|uniref:hypothetical protein n=1 Tax=Variovorax paradoxus TaxID=34073 RepID=UPI001ABBF92B